MAEQRVKTGGKSKESEIAGNKDFANQIALAVVKNNIDTARTGKLEVYLMGSGGGADSDDSGSAMMVSYMSPYMGVTMPGGDTTKGSEKEGNGKFLGNPHSYGMWAPTPEIGSRVLCIFDSEGNGYYIGSVPHETGIIDMIPGIAATKKVVPNDGEAGKYGKAARLPTTELNAANPAMAKSADSSEEPRPVHSYQASIIHKQGLLEDPIRGTVSSSAKRESPSRVFGISTPGQAIYKGGIKDGTPEFKSAGKDDLQVQGRIGGHTFVMDDGTADTGEDKLIRLRTSAGHTILMHDSNQSISIIHSSGLSWIEMNKEGTIDAFSTNSFNVRTKGDLNLQADNDINIHAGKKLNIYSEDDTNIQTSKDVKWRVDQNFAMSTAAKFGLKVGSDLQMRAAGSTGIKSDGVMNLDGSQLHLNNGANPSPAEVPKIPKNAHMEAGYDNDIGWTATKPATNNSIVSRAPSHHPWKMIDYGVNVKVNDSIPDQSAPSTTPQVAAANQASKTKPAAVAKPAEVAAAPAAKKPAGPVPTTSVKAMTAQVATSAQALTKDEQKQAGVINPASGLTAKALETAGAIAPGAGAQVAGLIAKGMPAAKALDGKLTGVDGVTEVNSLVKDTSKQAAIIQTAMTAGASSLLAKGILTGKESPAEAGGPVLAALTHGVENVASALKAGAGEVGSLVSGAVGKIDGALGSLKDSLASGKLSAGLGESLGGGLSGLNTSLSGLGDKLKGSLDNMKSGPQNMFAAMKDSFPNLKGGEINILGGGKADTKSPTELAANAYDSAKAEYDAAEEEWFNAKRDYSYSKSDEDYERIGKAEADKAAAQQKMTKASKAFMASVPGAGALADAAGNIGDKISASAGGIAKDLSASFDKLKGGGIEALPGGISALAATVNNKIPGGSNPLNNIKNSLTAVSGVADKVKGLTSGGSSDLASSLADPKKFAGGLISGASSKLEGLMGTKVGALAGDKALGESAAKGMMAQLQSSMDAMAGSNSELKPPVIASGTFDATSITASLGKLMGDSRIPIPSFDSLPPPDPNAAPKPKNEAEAKAYEAVEEAEYRVRNSKLNISLTEKASKSWPEQQRTEALEKARAGLAEEQDKLQKARVAYDAVINSTST